LQAFKMVAEWAGGLAATTPKLTQALALYRKLAKPSRAEAGSAIRKLYD
jgi:hypothetical protein